MEFQLKSKLDRAKNLEQVPRLVWQVVCKRLRLWATDEEGQACRPYAILLCELYPRGSVINNKLTSVSNKYPEATEVLDFILENILNPPSTEPMNRLPESISFVDENLTSQLSHLLKPRLGIQVSTLTLADGVNEFIENFSKKLVERDRGVRSDGNLHPGIMSVKGITKAMLLEFFVAADRFRKTAPWSRFKESDAFEVEYKNINRYLTVFGSGGKGFGAMENLGELKKKYQRANGILTTEQIEELNNDSDGESETCTIYQCGSCGKDPERQKFTYRCSRCKKICYCDEQCQRSDWRKHILECSKLVSGELAAVMRAVWTRRDFAILFVDPTAVPFDDLDFAEQENVPLGDDIQFMFPVPFVKVMGGALSVSKMERPKPHELEWITKTLRAFEDMEKISSRGEVYEKDGVKIQFAADLASKGKE